MKRTTLEGILFVLGLMGIIGSKNNFTLEGRIVLFLSIACMLVCFGLALYDFIILRKKKENNKGTPKK